MACSQVSMKMLGQRRVRSNTYTKQIILLAYAVKVPSAEWQAPKFPIDGIEDLLGTL